MALFNQKKTLITLIFFSSITSVNAGVNDFISGVSSDIQDLLLQNQIKPYIIPLEQGRLIENENFQQLDIGLSREQVVYLVGVPSSSPFNDNQWNYYYYDNLSSQKIKYLSIHFKNEKVFKILVDKKLYKEFGISGNGEVDLARAPTIPITNIDDEQIKEKVITITLADNYNSDIEPGLCRGNNFETFDDVKTLIVADESTLEIRADNQSQTSTNFVAEGNAEAERKNDMLTADKIVYDTTAKRVTASGNVSYFNDEITVYSKNAEYQGNEGDINFSDAKYFKSDKTASGLSDKIIFKNNKDVFLQNGTYTSCNVDDPDWELTSSSTELVKKSERGHSYNMFLKYKNIPVFYTPYISYPLTDKRQSGILTPSFGSAGDSGTSFSIPYYFNLANNYDATVEVTSLSDRGILFDNEFRYLGSRVSTLLNFTHLESDDEFGKDRYLYKIDDAREIINTLHDGNDSGVMGSRIKSEISYGRVSDLDYFDDFGDSLSTVSQSHVKREIRFYGESYSKDSIFDYELSSLSYQPSKSGVVEQYQTIPSIRIGYRNNRVRYGRGIDEGFNYDLKARIDKFEHKDNSKSEGTRYVVYPSVEMPIVTESWEVTPKLGVRHIDYNLSNNSQDPVSKTTPIASLRGKLYFEKYVGNKYYTLEPELYLLYIPVGNQDDNPIFDSGLIEFKYSLFAENKFTGEDRINDAKQMSLGLTHRIIDDVSGEELFSGTIGQIIYFDDRDVHLTDNTKSHSDASNIIGIMNARLNQNSSLSIGSVFNPHAGYGMRNNIRYRYNAGSSSRYKLFNADYRFFRGNEEEIDLSGVYSFDKDLSFVGKYNYSFSNSRSNVEDLIDTMFGIEFNSCCYAIKVVARNYWTGTKKDNVLYFEFLPKGLTTTNNKTSELLRKGVPGYIDRTEYE